VKEKRFFLEKKKQKTVPRWRPDDGPGTHGQTFFASFFQKRSASFPPPKIT
jgi:hypothetical protein